MIGVGRWKHLGLEDALAVLDAWTAQRVIVSVDLEGGAPGLAGMSGVLEPTRRDGDACTIELAGCEAWLRLPGAPCFRGASYDPDARILVLEFCGDPDTGAPAVLVDIQALAAPSPFAALLENPVHAAG